MMGKTFLLASTALGAALTAWPVAAQQQPTLEDRVKTLEQKVGDTTVSGRMYWDISHIDNKRDGVAQSNNGWGFDAKRFYISVDHRFNDMFSADVTTDFNYVSADGETQLFIKKAYLQANLEYFPKSSMTYQTMAQVRAAKGDKAAALKDLERAVELDPRNVQAKTQLQQLKP